MAIFMSNPYPSSTCYADRCRHRPLPAVSLPAAAPAVVVSAHRPRTTSRLSKALAASITAANSPTQSSAFSNDAEFAAMCGASGAVGLGPTARGRGLVLQQDMAEREALLTVPLHNSLVIADDPTSGISIFSDRQHQLWQSLHGDMPPLLLEFLQGDARWDARMAAWMLWLLQHPGALWQSYLGLVPAESDMCCLLNFSQAEIKELQVPSLMEEAATQAKWCAHLHAKYFSEATGDLSQLGLSYSLAESLWALGLVRSRTFSEDVNGEMLTLVVPYCDMANHCADNNSTFCISRDLKSFTLRSLKPVGQGEELSISYGACKPNSETLRDYGFVVPGNVHDRISFEACERGVALSPATKPREAAAAAADVGVTRGLNATCLLEATGFTGDLTSGKIKAGPSAQMADGYSLARQQEQVGRREAALLSLPVRRSDLGGSSSGGGLFGWLAEAAQPWTESGKPPPQPLRREEAATERAAVEHLQHHLQRQLAALPTSIDTDVTLLDELLGNDLDAHSTDTAPGITSSTVSARRQARLHRHVLTASSPRSSLASMDRRVPSKARHVTAIRARLEHKLLLQEGLHVLDQYQQYLKDRFGTL